MNFIELITALGITAFAVILTVYIGIFYILKVHIIEDIITSSLENLIMDAETNEELQKKVYTIGALLGNGIAAGSGMSKSLKGGGKLTLNSVIAEIAGNWIQQRQFNTSPSPSQPTPTPSTQTLTNTKPLSDKW